MYWLCLSPSLVFIISLLFTFYFTSSTFFVILGPVLKGLYIRLQEFRVTWLHLILRVFIIRRPSTPLVIHWAAHSIFSYHIWFMRLFGGSLPFCGFPVIWFIRCSIASLSFVPCRCLYPTGLNGCNWCIFICLYFEDCGDNLSSSFVVSVLCELLGFLSNYFCLFSV